MRVQDVHGQSLATSSALSSYYMKTAPTPAEVIGILNEENISFILVGAHGLGGWTQKPRATEDVDVLVALKQYKKALRALLAVFPHLETDDQEAVARLRDPETQKVVIDILKPNQPLFRVAFKHCQLVQAGGQRYKIPSLEMALAMKFAPMISLNRSDADRLQDVVDFMRMIQANPNIDLDQLAELGELVYPGGGAELLEKVRQVRAGEKLAL